MRFATVVLVPPVPTAVDDRHDPEATARDIARKLAPRARHVCMLIGAGASCAAGLPTLPQLQQKVVDALDGDDRTAVEALLGTRNLEQALSRLRRLAALLEDGEELAGVGAARAVALDEKICTAIMAAVDVAGADIAPFVRLASWAARMENLNPLEFFTVNYDLLIEAGFEEVGVPYFDGFVGGVEARFLPELIEPHDAPAARRLPSGFVRLWKLHDSTNWRSVGTGEAWRMIRVGGGSHAGASAIYPSDEKYEESRRVPFVVLMDRFRRALVEPETITLVTGYSFGDPHLNEMLFDAAYRHPRSEVLALCFGDLPAVLVDRASTTRNLVALSPTEAIIDGHRAEWRPSEDMPGVFEGGSFLLGDFARLADFLARRVTQTDAVI
jgi:hypothetical protein